MATARFAPGQKIAGSPRPKGRENSKETLCRNVLIYGHCRYEDQGCAFNHDPNNLHGQNEVPKKTLNVDSPSFTPTALAVTANSTISSRAASAAPFTPRGAASGAATPNLQVEETAAFNPGAFREFTPQAYDLSAANGAVDTQSLYDPFALPSANQTVGSGQYNPYLEDTSSIAATTNTYYGAQPTYNAPAQPVQYHLYAPIGPHREDLLPYQRTAHDFFMSDKLREDLQRRSEAALQFIPNSQLPSVDHYHTLVALDTSHHKSVAVFAYPSWVYKATSSKNGNSYCLRRLEGYRLTNEKAIRSVKDWKRVDCGGVVSVHDAFTTRAFGDSSLIIVTDYHPLSKTLADAHIASPARYNRASSSAIAETVLWNYIVQIASAIKSVHAANLAVRCLEPSKVLLTDKNRVRLSACGVLDVVMFETAKPLGDLQAEDLVSFGRLILSIATHTALTPAPNAIKGAMEQFGRSYGAEMRDAVMWLVTPAPAPAPQQQTAVSQTQAKSIDQFLQKISGHVLATLDSAFHTHDSLTSELCRELENGRLARLLLKLGTINDRPEHAGDPSWSQSGDRYLLSLFRDYVFHQVDAQGNAVVDLAHMISALNKLDAGSEEKVLLTSRDEQSVFVVSYRELKKLVAGAFGELGKGVAKGGRGY